MADKVEDNVEQKPVETKEPEEQAVEPKAPEPVYQDNSAMAEIQKQIEELKKQNEEVSKKAQKFDKITEAVTGQPDRVKTDEKFFRDFADNPEETLAKFLETHTNKEVKELKEKIEKKEISDSNARAAQNLMKFDPDYENVSKNMNKFIDDEEFKRYQNQPDGFEVLYGKAKLRMGFAEANKKVEENKAQASAKNLDSKTSVSETPSGGKIGQETEQQRRDRERLEARKSGNDKKAVDISWEDLEKSDFFKGHDDINM